MMLRRVLTIWITILLSVSCTVGLAQGKIDSLKHAAEHGLSTLDRAKAYNSLAYCYVDSVPGTALEFARMGFAKSLEAAHDSSIHNALNIMRYVHYLCGDHENLLRFSLEALRISKRMEDLTSISDDMGWIMLANLELGNTTKAMSEGRKAVAIARTSGDTVAICRALTDMMNGLVKVDQFDEAFQLGQEALSLYETIGDEPGTAFTLTQLGDLMNKQKRFSEGLPFLLQAQKIINADERLLVDKVWNARYLATAYMGMRDLSNASKQLLIARRTAEQMKIRGEFVEILKSESELAELQGDLASALKLHKQFKELNDSMHTERSAQRMEGMHAIYELEAKDIENERLRQENILNESAMASQKDRNSVLLSSAMVLVILVLVLFVQLRQMVRIHRRLKRSNSIVREQTEEIRAKNLELEQQNIRLAATLISEEEKEVLLKEIHHRVKNNLQIVSSLLRIQTLSSTDPEANEFLEACQGRIASMALIHQQLYRTNDLSHVDLIAYVRALAKNVLASFGAQDRVELDLRISVPNFDIDTLIPLGLLLNELITNSAKHAFKNDSPGSIRVELRAVGPKEFKLRYSDSGNILNNNDHYSGESFGMELIHMLADQLNGTIRLLRGDTVGFELSFADEQASDHITSGAA